MKKTARYLTAAALLIATGTLTGCISDSDTASRNLSTEAEQFRVQRKIVFYNGITDSYIATVTGRCSVDEAEAIRGALAVTCKVADNQYIKDYLGRSDNVTWFMLQEEPVDASVYNYEVIFKPQAVVPDLRVESGNQ